MDRAGRRQRASGNAFATPYEEIARGDGARLDLERSPDDLIFLYTGGTTGMPKGVMWTQGAICERSAAVAAR